MSGGRFHRWLERLDDGLNPIVVKELRQAVQGRFAAAVLVAFLVLAVGGLSIFLLSTDVSGNFSNGQVYGSPLFLLLQGLLNFVCVLAIPAYGGARLLLERGENRLDLLYVTTLSPRAVVAGKFLACLTLILLLYSACLPFMTFTYFLRGIDLPSIFVLLLFSFGATSVCLMVTLLVACLPGGTVLRVFLGMATLGGLLVSFIFLQAGVVALLESGIGSRLGSAVFWGGAAGLAGSALWFAGWAFLLAVALIAPETANRALPLRVWGLITWAVTAGVAVVVARVVPSVGEEALAVWVWAQTVLLCLALLVAVSARDLPSQRVARAIPQGAGRRAAAFLLFSGSANGILWAVVLAALTFALGAGVASPGATFNDALPNAVEQGSVLFLYTLVYSLAALLLARGPLRHRLPRQQTWAVALTLATVCSLLPVLVTFVLLPGAFSWQVFWMLPNPFAALRSDLRLAAAIFAGGSALVLGLVLWRWFFAQFRAFKPPVPAEIPLDA